MSPANNSYITLEIEAGAEPIRGVMEHRDGRREPFWGWLELIEELRRVAADTPERAPPAVTERGPGCVESLTDRPTQPQPDTTTQEKP